MSEKVLILGSTGMLGHMVLKVLSKEKDMEIAGTHLADETDPLYFDVEAGLQKLDEIDGGRGGFKYVINCIGITADRINVDDSESLLRAIRINAAFPHELAMWANHRDVKIIQISTDGVFSGEAESYDEDAPCDCMDIYGKTKSLGEVVHRNFLNIRCSIIGPSPYERAGLYEWFISQPDGAVISGYTNHLWNGVSTAQFAELCLAVIRGNHFVALREESPVLHFAPNRPVSKYELLKLFQKVAKKNISVVPVEHGGGAVKRILKTKHKGIKRIYPGDTSMDEMIFKMSTYS